jgi:secreted trypsin-like serine protease
VLVRTCITAGLTITAAVLTSAPASAISGGVESPAAYSFLGSLQRPESPRPDGHVCGATLIAPQWMVTAGHCVRTDSGAPTGNPDGWQVRIGSTSVTSGGELIEVEKFIKNPGGIIGSDIALLKLKTPATSAPIAIAAATPADGTTTRILGWGMTCDQLQPECFPDHLREADTVVQPDTACADSGIVAETEMCVGSLDGSISATNMDSGGPAVVKAGDGWALAGAVSGSNNSHMPTTYTDVTTFRAWISENMKDYIDVANEVTGHDYTGYVNSWIYGATTPPMPTG